MVIFPDISPEVTRFNQSFYHEFEASTPVGLMPMIPMIIASHGWVCLRGVHLDWRKPYKIWQVTNEGQ